jgi:16S rRNA (uracil1498-N3)-methyltransferase
MRVPRIYTHQTLGCELLVELEPSASQHIARAMRMQVGDSLTLFNGCGGEYDAIINSVGNKTVQVAVGEHRAIESESPLAVHLAIALSRGERMDWIVQKATELGVASITPLVTERVEVKLKGDRAEKKRLHWQRIAVSACEQCGRNQVPDVSVLQPLGQWLASTEADCKLVLHHRAAALSTITQKPNRLALLVGPEGGLSADEIAAAQASGFLALTLGPRVMRTETAPLAALAILQARWGDMNPQ